MKIWRTVGLVILIGFDLALLVTLAIFKVWWWFMFFLGITLSVIQFEIFSSLVLGKTISQQFWAWRREHKVASMIAVIFFLIAMAGLGIHLLM